MSSVIAAPATADRQLGLQVLRLRLQEESALLDGLWRTLDDAERERAARFARKPDRARFVVGRARLRQMLGQRLGVAPAALQLRPNAYGKPLLESPASALHFNVSHSGTWVLIAVDDRGPVGIDVEAVRPELAEIDDFRAVLAPEEAAHLDATVPAQRALAFARTWVRKEAYVKALGQGVGRELREFAVVDGVDGRPVMLYDRNPGGDSASWQFEDLTLDAAHVGCLVRGSRNG